MSTQRRRLQMFVAVISLLVSLYAVMMLMLHQNSVSLTDGIATGQIRAEMRTPTEMSAFLGPIVELTLTKTSFWPMKVVIPQGLTLNNLTNPPLVLLQSEELFWGNSHKTTLLAYTLDYHRTAEGAIVYELGPVNNQLVPTLNNIVARHAELQLASQLAVWRTFYPQETIETFQKPNSRDFTPEEIALSTEIINSTFASPALDSGVIPWLPVLVISIILTVSLLVILIQPLPLVVPPPLPTPHPDDKDKSITYLTDFKLIKQNGITAHVYSAIDKRSRKKVIIKFINIESSAPPYLLEYRFESEIKYHKELNHGNMAQFIDKGTHRYPLDEQDTQPRECFVQEFIDGCTLRELRKKGKLPDVFIFEITAQLIDVLIYIHQQKVMHRDLNPNNIMIDQKGQVYLIDFGIATANSSSYTEIKFPGVTFGTKPYAPPQRFENVPAKDYYALALVIVYMKQGPWWHANPTEEQKMEVVRQINQELGQHNRVVGHILQWFLSGQNNSAAPPEDLTKGPARQKLGKMVQELMAEGDTAVLNQS